MPTPRRHANSAARQRAYRIRRREGTSLGEAPAQPGPARWRALRKNALKMLEAMAAEMREYAGQRTDAWQESGRGQEFEERIELVEAARDAVEEIP